MGTRAFGKCGRRCTPPPEAARPPRRLRPQAEEGREENGRRPGLIRTNDQTSHTIPLSYSLLSLSRLSPHGLQPIALASSSPFVAPHCPL
eukprot:9035511-Pyramimonas_sp.AAC.1